MKALDEHVRRDIEETRQRIDQSFREAAEAHPELAEYEGHKGLSTWAYDNWEDDLA